MILDEPMSGLDPNQVLELRELVRELGKERTVLFSSHVLSEVEACCERAVVIHRGERVAAGTLQELLDTRPSEGLRIRGEPAEDLERALQDQEGVEALRLGPGFFDVSGLEAREVFALARDRGIVLSLLAPRPVSLEDVFAGLTRGGDL